MPGHAGRPNALAEGQATPPPDDGQKPGPRDAAPVDHVWNAAQSRVMGEWAGANDAVFDDEPPRATSGGRSSRLNALILRTIGMLAAVDAAGVRRAMRAVLR